MKVDTFARRRGRPTVVAAAHFRLAIMGRRSRRCAARSPGFHSRGRDGMRFARRLGHPDGRARSPPTMIFEVPTSACRRAAVGTRGQVAMEAPLLPRVASRARIKRAPNQESQGEETEAKHDHRKHSARRRQGYNRIPLVPSRSRISTRCRSISSSPRAYSSARYQWSAARVRRLVHGLPAQCDCAPAAPSMSKTTRRRVLRRRPDCFRRSFRALHAAPRTGCSVFAAGSPAVR